MRGFISPSKEDMEYQVNFRVKEYGKGWYYDTIEIPEEQIGICWNSFPKIKTPSMLVYENSPMCSVGMIRTERSGDRSRTDDLVTDDESSFFGGCRTCPYFISRIQLTEIMDSNFKKNGE